MLLYCYVAILVQLYESRLININKLVMLNSDSVLLSLDGILFLEIYS